MSKIRKTLTKMHKLAQTYRQNSQMQMKEAVYREFKEGDNVLVLLPLNEQLFSARYQGSYTIAKKVSYLNYLVNMPKHRKKMYRCHINMLKKYLRWTKE